MVKNIGLRGVKVADTKVSFIDGTNGVLLYRGYQIEDLAKNSTFEETAYLIINGVLPSKTQLEDFKNKIASERKLPKYVIDSMKLWPKETKPMNALMAVTPLISFTDLSGDDTLETNINRAISLIAKFPTAVASWHRIRNNELPIEPAKDFAIAEDFLYQLTGKEVDKEIARVLDVCLILHADHTFNASTFACRQVVSTLADMYAGVLGGLSALSGPLHGGANEKVMEMLLQLEHVQDIEGWVKTQLDSGQKIMGIGHAVYKTEDPRAIFLKEMGYRLGQKLNQPIWSSMLERIEKTATSILTAKGKTGLKANVDFYSAAVYYLIGLKPDLFTPIFAMSRITGWCAHILEEKFALAQPSPALYRPSAEYVGSYCGLMGCEYKSVNNRDSV
jgi:citrate synthase